MCTNVPPVDALLVQLLAGLLALALFVGTVPTSSTAAINTATAPHTREQLHVVGAACPT